MGFALLEDAGNGQFSGIPWHPHACCTLIGRIFCVTCFFGRNSEKYFCKVQSWPFFLLKNHMNLEITYCAKETVACFFFVVKAIFRESCK